jgi:hypothetical protein
MSRVSWRPMPGLERPALVAAPGRDAAVCAVVVVLTAGVFAAVGDHGTLTSGISCAVVTALMVGQIQRRVEERQGAA